MGNRGNERVELHRSALSPFAGPECHADHLAGNIRSIFVQNFHADLAQNLARDFAQRCRSGTIFT